MHLDRVNVQLFACCCVRIGLRVGKTLRELECNTATSFATRCTVLRCAYRETATQRNMCLGTCCGVALLRGFVVLNLKSFTRSPWWKKTAQKLARKDGHA